MEGNKKN